MKIPCKITLLGDKDYAKNFIGAAQSQLRILEDVMSFQKLKQGIRKVSLGPRVMVEANVCFGLSEVKILCPFIGKEDEGISAQECFCCCCWAMGFIIGYTEEEHTCSDEGCSDCEVRYDVKVCQGDRYSLFQGCISTDFAHYRIGEQVFVLVANSATDGWGYTNKDVLAELFTFSKMYPAMLFSFDEYKLGATKNDFEKCEDCERKRECEYGLRNCKTIKEGENEESSSACKTEKISIVVDNVIHESRNCGEYQFEKGSACKVKKESIPPFYIVPIGCSEESGKWLKAESTR